MRHMTNGLSFNTLRNANNERRKRETHAYICCRKWTTAHWMQAFVGEIGELANLLKKVDRGDFSADDVKGDIADELGDIQAYLDILACELGVHLGEATKNKFNKISDRVGSPVFIGDDDDWHLNIRGDK